MVLLALVYLIGFRRWFDSVETFVDLNGLFIWHRRYFHNILSLHVQNFIINLTAHAMAVA